MDAAYVETDEGAFLASPLTVGPWHPDHQHAGPPSALICRAVEREAARRRLDPPRAADGQPAAPGADRRMPDRRCADYVGRNAGHFSGRLTAGDKEIARFTALMQREDALPIFPTERRAIRPPHAPKPVDESPVVTMAFDQGFGYAGVGREPSRGGTILRRPLLRLVPIDHPLVKGEEPSAYQRVAVAADSGNGISASLDFTALSLRQQRPDDQPLPPPDGDVDLPRSQRSLFGGNGCGLAELALYDETGLIGRASQSLAVRRR